MERLLAGLRAAAEPTRLRLLTLCAHGELTVSELTQILGQSQPRVSRHLKLLCEAGLLERFREGTHAFFTLAKEGEGARLAELLVDLVPDEDVTPALDLERLQTIKAARAEVAAKYFRENAGQWDRMRSLYIDEALVERALLDSLQTEDIHDFVDVGTGTGRILELIAPRVGRAVGVDLSREMLSVARAHIEKSGLRNVSVRHGDMYQLPWAAGSFDGATIHQVLHFADDPAGAIAEVARVLRPGGVLLIVDFAPHDLEFLRTEHAHRRLGFRDAEVRQWLMAAGLAPEEVRELPGDPLTVAIWRARRGNGGNGRAGAARSVR
ncbi:MAG TPA: metalloregulator ArsR/SmtB family transcription factor [Alphaproteobacteria bacterium]|nr:metalloregulator ArsR/SmtB family transcription factor [Alphaproteobacteria bacterium]